MHFDNQDNDMLAERLIIEFKSITSVEEMLKYMLAHLYALDANLIEKFRNQIVEYEKLLANVKFMRAIRYRDAMIRESAEEYFGDDYGDDDPYMYNEELEEEIQKISMRLLATLGMVVKQLKNKSVDIGDDA
jgi:hypothetical protein